jgi:hypothetical protein
MPQFFRAQPYAWRRPRSPTPDELKMNQPSLMGELFNAIGQVGGAYFTEKQRQQELEMERDQQSEADARARQRHAAEMANYERDMNVVPYSRIAESLQRENVPRSMMERRGPAGIPMPEPEVSFERQESMEDRLERDPYINYEDIHGPVQGLEGVELPGGIIREAPEEAFGPGKIALPWDRSQEAAVGRESAAYARQSQIEGQRQEGREASEAQKQRNRLSLQAARDADTSPTDRSRAANSWLGDAKVVTDLIEDLTAAAQKAKTEAWPGSIEATRSSSDMMADILATPQVRAALEGMNVGSYSEFMEVKGEMQSLLETQALGERERRRPPPPDDSELQAQMQSDAEATLAAWQQGGKEGGVGGLYEAFRSIIAGFGDEVPDAEWFRENILPIIQEIEGQAPAQE